MEPVIGFLENEEYTDDYDESKLPCSGLEYLRRVQQEATECPDVVVADIRNKKHSKQTVDIKTNNLPVPPGATPSYKWQMQQTADFADIRQKIARFQAKNKKTSNQCDVTLPNKNDEQQWRLFCLGRSYGCERNSTEIDSSESNSTIMDSQDGALPLSSILFRMNQVTVQQVLEYHVNWLEQETYSHVQGRWLYSLLACLEKPLLPETVSLLRTLARHCAQHRMKEVEKNSDDDELVVSLNLIITLVTRYFGQTDLADPG
ncbi:gem-associated protein 2 [Exaiptasia diaphana]|uniref:Gem-associated protein 2 n=1 Tax=Exaiptasia diaphana TaxID=2652724 RepID=A0A913X954_EXADI|nr:gem-associated protein 2 [Exaiptasia diaphana]